MHRPHSSAGTRLPWLHGHDGQTQELRQSLARTEQKIEARLELLADCWRSARTADKTLAITRLAREAEVDRGLLAELDAHEERIQDLWSAIRHAKASSDPSTVRLTVLPLELDLQQAESDRDGFIAAAGLEEPLLSCGETFLRTTPFARGERPLSELCDKRDALIDQLSAIEARKKADKRRAGIRMLAPRYASCDGIPVLG
jgi:hypothetical protein